MKGNGTLFRRTCLPYFQCIRLGAWNLWWSWRSWLLSLLSLLSWITCKIAFMKTWINWFDLLGPRIVYELDHSRPVLYVCSLCHPDTKKSGKTVSYPTGDNWTIIPHQLCDVLPSSLSNRKPGSSTRGHTVICNGIKISLLALWESRARQVGRAR
jgi:hypothetical protein